MIVPLETLKNPLPCWTYPSPSPRGYRLHVASNTRLFKNSELDRDRRRRAFNQSAYAYEVSNFVVCFFHSTCVCAFRDLVRALPSAISGTHK